MLPSASPRVSWHACRGRRSRRLFREGALTVLGGALLAFGCGSPAQSQVVPYNPYADSQDPTPPVLADGTIHWGTFYKSAAMQKAYERLWNLGACRNTNKAITIPVENNRLKIDTLPQSTFRGVVKAVTGGNSGGMVAFVESPSDGSHPLERVALLHPAGVSRVDVTGTAPPSFLTPGMAVRFQATVDAKGRSREPLAVIHVVAPAADAKPVAVTADREELIVGKVVSIKRGTLSVRVDAGKIRRLTLPLTEDAEVRVAGDAIEIEGRLWTGEGALGDGSVFADRVTVLKKGPARTEAAMSAPPDGVTAR